MIVKGPATEPAPTPYQPMVMEQLAPRRNVFVRLWRWLRQAEALRIEADALRACSRALSDAVAECKASKAELTAALAKLKDAENLTRHHIDRATKRDEAARDFERHWCDAEREKRQTEKKLADAQRDAAELRAQLSPIVEQRDAALSKLKAFLADVPRDLPDVEWTKDDANALAHFLEVSPAGKKLALHLTNRLADYERDAVLYSTPADAALRLKRCHGFRECRGEILRLSAAGPSPAKHVAQDMALPDDLENLRA